MGLNQFREEELPYLINLFITGNGPHRIRNQILAKAHELLHSRSGMEILYNHAPELDRHHFFSGTPWHDIRSLNPPLVRGTLEADTADSAAEVISNLRILAIALGAYSHHTVSPGEAQLYLDKVIALNIDLLFEKETEEARVKQKGQRHPGRLMMEFITKRYSSLEVLNSIIEEIEKLEVQRGITTAKIESLIYSGLEMLDKGRDCPEKFIKYAKAVSSRSASFLTKEEFKMEALHCSKSMLDTGIVSASHVSLIQFINVQYPDLLPDALGLTSWGRDNLQKNIPLIKKLITSAVTVDTKQTVYALSRMLERDILTDEMVSLLELLLITAPCSSVKHRLELIYRNEKNADIHAHLVSGIILVLGQPLGVGQGYNPSCQSTRAISFWSQTDPVHLARLYLKAISDNEISLFFEGSLLLSSQLRMEELNYSIPMDPVSIVLLPHLNALYGECLRLAGSRDEDPHKWVNPAFYGPGVLAGFADLHSCPSFLTLFYRYYHPASLENIQRMLPQPAGILIYDRDEKALGAHAILIQRVAPDPEGNIRVYFYNPNNDSSQVWGRDMEVQVQGHGELPGEASLLYYHFTRCLYAFHY
ncbi:hypothetical protein [Peribacillus kribbensis]|uniref:hypothetical protein n=1 Tax=Peribacillus kribbensis TaxID=356658 RepID=UPI000424121D|nr:hypothetical protein [Peribacillus kribbensis]